jgi:hypothetical protein
MRSQRAGLQAEGSRRDGVERSCKLSVLLPMDFLWWSSELVPIPQPFFLGYLPGTSQPVEYGSARQKTGTQPQALWRMCLHSCSYDRASAHPVNYKVKLSIWSSCTGK